MAFCQNCGTRLEDTFEYCPECGIPILTAGRSQSEVRTGPIRKCFYCGEILDTDANICPTCGHIQRDGESADNTTEDITAKAKRTASDVFKGNASPLFYILIILFGLYILTEGLYSVSLGEILIIVIILACVYRFQGKHKKKK